MKIQLPEQFVNRMSEMLGEEIQSFLEAYEDDNYHGLRINPLKGYSIDDMDEGEDYAKLNSSFRLRPVPWCQTGFYYDEDERPGRHPYHHAGAYYIQEPSAMLVGELASPKPGMRVLDLCAAPGGKTSHLAGMMKGQGILVANEIVPNRAKILSQNVERMGIRNCIVTCENPDRLADVFAGFFDLIVVDTPCSGEGMFRRDEIARNEWSPSNVDMCADRSRDILAAADRMLRYGGKLVYSTCTFAPAEDEQAIGTFLQEHPDYHIEHVEIEKHIGSADEDGWISQGRADWSGTDIEEIKDTFRLWPHRLHGEGHYAAVIRKGQEGCLERMQDYSVVQPPKSRDKGRKNDKSRKNDKNVMNLDRAIQLFEEFADKYLNYRPEGEYRLFGDNLYIMPYGLPDIGRLRLERIGLQLGELKKDRFEPSHALAMALNKSDCRNVMSISDESEMLKYLRGEAVLCENELSGWTLVCFNNYSSGWGKATGGMMKNHYPKGLRIKM